MANPLSELSELPPSMRSRAVWARKQILQHPETAEIDEDELLAWVWHEEDHVWYSIAGNFSSKSPKEKMAKRIEYINRNQENKNKYEESYLKMLAEQKYYSEIRRRILERDGYQCQKCGIKIGKLEIHHIVKRTEGRIDADDNLITVCKKCHKQLDGKDYGIYENKIYG